MGEYLLGKRIGEGDRRMPALPEHKFVPLHLGPSSRTWVLGKIRECAGLR